MKNVPFYAVKQSLAKEVKNVADKKKDVISILLIFFGNKSKFVIAYYSNKSFLLDSSETT